MKQETTGWKPIPSSQERPAVRQGVELKGGSRHQRVMARVTLINDNQK